MASPHTRYIELFPTARAIPESLQIGRRDVIDSIEGMARGGTSVLLLEERRIGKSSVGLAVVDRIRATGDGALALNLDLRYVSRHSVALAAEMLAQARAQGADRHVAGLLARQRLSRAGRSSKALITEAGTVLGEQDEATIVTTLLAALGAGAPSSVGHALQAIDAYARLRDRRVVIFFDEIQELARWPDSAAVQRGIAATETRMGSRVSYIFAGSERTAIAELFVAHGELEFVGQRVELPAIPIEEWTRGLEPRFRAAGLAVGEEQIAQIYVATDGHPLRTMSVCAQALRIVPGDEVTEAVVRQAVAAARDHPSWRLG